MNKMDNTIINFNDQPVSNRFLKTIYAKAPYFPLKLSWNKDIGCPEILKPWPVEELKPKYDWITCFEPEEHLDHLVNVIGNLPNITKKSKVCGVSYKEDTTLARLNNLGFENTWRIDMNKDLGISDKKANLESIQHYLKPGIVNSIHDKYGIPDLIIVRHILEHTHDTHSFMLALKKLVNPSGYIIFEVPDCTEGFEKFDYTTIWEEHILYFTDLTFKNCLNSGGFLLHYFEKYNYSFESVLIGIVKPDDNKNTFKNFNIEKNILDREIVRTQNFTKQLVKKQDSIKKFLKDFKQNHDNIVIFGTGHAACMFINLLGIKDLIDFAIDDNHKKKGFYMPGSKLPIYSSDALIQKKINLCLLGLSSESEKKIINKYKSFEKNGGIFASIYPTSRYAIQV